jgi:hypothetical protein
MEGAAELAKGQWGAWAFFGQATLKSTATPITYRVIEGLVVVGKVEDNFADLLEKRQVADGWERLAQLLDTTLHNRLLRASDGDLKALCRRRKESAGPRAQLDGLADHIGRLPVFNQLDNV